MRLINRWKRKYYNKTAFEVIMESLELYCDKPDFKVVYKELSRESKLRIQIEATKHSLRKWEGLLYLGRFTSIEGRNFNSSLIIDKQKLIEVDLSGNHLDWLSVDGGTCSLCQLFLYYNDETCSSCPITQATGINCDFSFEEDEEELSPYQMFSFYGVAGPMYQTLLKTYAYLYAELSAEQSSIIPVKNI